MYAFYCVSYIHIICLQTLTINGNPRLAYVHSGAITDVPRLAALDLSRNALFALESALPARFPASHCSPIDSTFSNSLSLSLDSAILAGEFPSKSQSNLPNAFSSVGI